MYCSCRIQLCIVCTVIRHLPTVSHMCIGYVEAEKPNNRLHKFVGTLTYNDQQYSLDNEKIVLRVRYF